MDSLVSSYFCLSLIHSLFLFLSPSHSVTHSPPSLSLLKVWVLFFVCLSHHTLSFSDPLFNVLNPDIFHHPFPRTYFKAVDNSRTLLFQLPFCSLFHSCCPRQQIAERCPASVQLITPLTIPGPVMLARI